MATRRRAKPPLAKAEGIVVESRQDLINAYKQVFSTVEGQIVLADLVIRFAYNTRPMYTPSTGFSEGTRPNDVIFTEGQRSVILHIGAQCDARPDNADDQGKVEL